MSGARAGQAGMGESAAGARLPSRQLSAVFHSQLGPYRDAGEPPALARNPIPAPTGRLQPGKMAALPVAGCLHGRVICLRTQATVDRGWRFAESAQAYPGMLLHVCGPGGAGGRASPSYP